MVTFLRFLLVEAFFLVLNVVAVVDGFPSLAFLLRKSTTTPAIVVPAAITSLFSTTATSSSISDTVQIHDRVFSADACVALHHLALDHAARNSQDGWSVFFRDTPPSTRTPIEHALQSYLDAVGDPHDIIVEYWSRQQHVHMDVHADVDEQELHEEERLRYPECGHVLYLSVGSTATATTTSDNLRGPTCVFPHQLGGWTTHTNSNTHVMVTVPAVPGRVLRFPGRAMHAVPKPAHRFLLDDEEERRLLEELEFQAVANVDEDTSRSGERSVILFNTWSREGPRGVDEDYSSESFTGSKSKAQRVAGWHQAYGPDCQELGCQPRSQWEPVDIVADQHDDDISESSDPTNPTFTTPVRLPLMGWKERRLHPKKKVQLTTSSSLRSGLDEVWQPRSYELVEKTS